MNEYQPTIDRCKELGTDKEFQKWVKTQPNMLGGESEVYAHVRRSWNAGTGMKPLFSGIPLTDWQHRLQHQKGELAMLQAHGYLMEYKDGDEAVYQAKRMINEWAEMYRQEWILTKEKDDG